MSTVHDAYRELIEQSGLFDAGWYGATYGVAQDALVHYLTVGATRGHSPSPHFDGPHYWQSNPDVKAEGFNPLLHYLLHGRGEGRALKLLVDPAVEAAAKAPPKAPQRTPPKTPPKTPPDASVAAKPKPSSKVPGLRGAINNPRGNEPVVRGWLAKMGDASPRVALLIVDQQPFEVTANLFRADLKKHNVNAGLHAFEFVPPVTMVDGKTRTVALVDKLTGEEISSMKVTWSQDRNFVDFQGFLAHSLVSPTVSAPFREEDKRCFAFMENMARHLARIALALPQPPLVSVVMPVHNRASTVLWAIDSVLKQSYTNLQLVVVDDGSQDGSVALVEGLNEPRIKLIRINPCSGVSNARNVALQAAEGTYVCYLDSDNTWQPDYVAAMVGAFHELPDAEALSSGQLLFRGDQPDPFAVRFGSLNRSLLKNRNFIDMNAFCHKRELIDRVGAFDTSLRRFVDWDLILRVAESARLYSVPVVLSNYYYDKAANAITNDPTFAHHIEKVRAKIAEREAARRLVCVPVKKKTTVRPKRRGKVTVIIPSYQALDDITECVQSFEALHAASWVKLVIVDNASAPPVRAYLAGLAERKVATVIQNEVNYGFTFAVNQGIRVADPKSDIVLLNNDALLTAGALEALQDFARSRPDCGLTVPAQVLPGGTKTIMDHVPFADGGFDCDVNISAHHRNVVKVPPFFDGGPLEISFAPFFCVYIKRQVLGSIDGLDAEFGRHYRSDRLLCDYVRHVLGLKIFHVPAAVVYHKLQKATDGLRTSGEAGKAFDYIFKRNQWEPELAETLGFRTAAWDVF
jgi:GT2 family glycosyltransferase